MKTDGGSKQYVIGKLKFESVKRIKRLMFLLLEHRFFRDSEEGSALPLRLPRIFCPLSFMLHVLKSRAFALLWLQCYFVKLESKIVGLFAIQEHDQSLFVASLGVAKEYRRLGMGTYILRSIETIARYMGKKWMEVDVLTKNTSALRLYTKYGFTFIQSRKKPFVMRGKKLCRSGEYCA